MLVSIYDAGDDHEIKIVLPTDLILNPLTAAITAKTVSKKINGKSCSHVRETAEELVKAAGQGSEEEITAAAKDIVVESLSETAAAMNIDAKTVSEAFRVLKKFKKAHPGLPLVDIHDADGSRVTIML